MKIKSTREYRARQNNNKNERTSFAEHVMRNFVYRLNEI